LTGRELEVVRLVAEGLTNTEIATRLWVSPATARSHMCKISQKFHAHGRAHIAAMAVQAGLVTVEVPDVLRAVAR